MLASRFGYSRICIFQLAAIWFSNGNQRRYQMSWYNKKFPARWIPARRSHELIAMNSNNDKIIRHQQSTAITKIIWIEKSFALRGPQLLQIIMCCNEFRMAMEIPLKKKTLIPKHTCPIVLKFRILLMLLVKRKQNGNVIEWAMRERQKKAVTSNAYAQCSR